ncbi:MAG: hypothetical protein KF773_36795 [Deltaproteobacteria bacterium]|nr:hypothetical protein [Deltaproteobacteria bacterium]
MSRDDIELMQHADGELDERLDAEVRGRLDRDPEARAVVDSLGEISELVRGRLELAGDAVPDRRFENMWRTIHREIASEAPAVTEDAPKRAGLWGRISGWFDRYRGHVITGAVSAGAVAALALVLRPGSEAPTAPTGMNTPIIVQPAAMRAVPVIESLETPGANAAVLNIEDEDGHAAVIWVTPADTVEGI